MKLKQTGALLLTAALTLSLAACGGKSSSASSGTETPKPTSSALPTELPEATSPEVIENENSYTDWMPTGVERVMSETKANPDLEKAIIDYYQIPEEEWANTKYYYNYVDLNGDGTDEILAVVMGSYTSGSGGDSMLWVLPGSNMAVNQAFTLIRTPIIVTKDAVNGQQYGAKGLIVQRFGGGAEAETVMLTCSDGTYTTVNDGEPVKDLDSVEGTAIICNDLTADAESGSYLTLASK